MNFVLLFLDSSENTRRKNTVFLVIFHNSNIDFGENTRKDDFLIVSITAFIQPTENILIIEQARKRGIFRRLP